MQAPSSAHPPEWWPDQAALCAQTTRCGDEVQKGKPAPDCFRAAAERMGVPPEACLVIEDAPAGVAAATAAGMRVVAVPSIRDRSAYPDPDRACTAGLCLLLRWTGMQ